MQFSLVGSRAFDGNGGVSSPCLTEVLAEEGQDFDVYELVILCSLEEMVSQVFEIWQS